MLYGIEENDIQCMGHEKKGLSKNKKKTETMVTSKKMTADDILRSREELVRAIDQGSVL